MSVAMFVGSAISELLGVFVGASLKGSLLLLAAWALTRVARNAPASLRHLVWASALGGMLALPILRAVVPSVGVAVLPALGTPTADVVRPVIEQLSEVRTNTEARRAASLDEETAAAELASARIAGPTFDWRDLVRYAPLAWLLVVAVVLARLALGTIRISIWTRRACPVDDGAWLSLVQRLAARLQIARPVTLLRSERACVPMTWGVVYPTVLLPVDADEWPSDRRAIVLLHELAHVKRLDAFTQIVAQVAVAVFWFNPLVWLAARQMRIEREHACDDFVLAGGARPTDYAHDLLQIARSLGGSSAPAVAALAMARRSEFEGRLLAILDPHAHRYGVSKARVAAAAAMVIALAIPLAAVTPKRGPSASTTTRSATPSASATAIAALTPTSSSIRKQDAPPVSPERELALTLPDLPAPALASPALEQLVDRLGPSAAVPILPAPASKQAPLDLETLIAVARSAARMTSDYDKAELLITVAKHYVRDDELRTAYLDAAGTITSSFDQARVLLPMMLKDDLPPHAIEQVVKIAKRMSSDFDKASLLVSTINDHESVTPSIRDAMIAAAGTIGSDYDRARTVVAIVNRGGLDNMQLIGLIGVIKPITSSYDKARSLVALSSGYDLSDKQVREAFLAAAETITSADDYRRVIASVLK
jgi:beta-lactamase regulating signal transducer with metallopeptidase domain